MDIGIARSLKLKTRPWRPDYQGQKSLSLKSKTNRLLDFVTSKRREILTQLRSHIYDGWRPPLNT